MEFSIAVDGYRRAPRWRLAAAFAGLFGLGYGAWLLSDTPVDVFLLLLSGLPILLWLFFKREPLVRGLLRVDEAGRPAWSAQLEPLAEVSPAIPVRLVRWHRSESTVWIRIRREDDWWGDLFIDHGRSDAEAWVRLQRWLTWVERGVEPGVEPGAQ
jgi:hypothetical protein